MTLLPIQNGYPWKDKIQAVVDYWQGPDAAPAMDSDLERRTRMNQIATDLGLPLAANGESWLSVRAKYNAIIAATGDPCARILEIFGAKSRLMIDPWGRQDLTVEGGGAISQITDRVAGVVFSQPLGSSQPAATNGSRKVPRGDGLDDYLETTSMGWAKQENYSAFGVARIDGAHADGPSTLISWGGNVNTGPRLLRQVAGGVGYVRASVGTGSGNVQTNNVAEAIWTGAVTYWLDVKATEFDLYVNNVFVGTTPAVPSLTATRARIFSAQGNTPGAFGAMNLGPFGFVDLATTAERNACAPLLAAIANNLQAA